ncbi:MAG: LysM peptidoglycan-binding domain-containing protein [Ilumatobacteraceae bacterium]
MKSNVLLVALSAAVLASCGAATGSSPNQTVLGLTSTNYVTVTQTPTTLTPTTLVAGTGTPGTVHPEEGSYVIAAGDYPANIAKTYKVAFTDLLAINGWTLAGNQVPEFPAVGATIKIPPGWTEPGTAPDTSGTTASGTTPSAPTTTIAGGQSTCAPGEYTIVAGDFLGKVAKKLDTTVDALNAANTGTKNYSSFYPGLVIKTPPKANC